MGDSHEASFWSFLKGLIAGSIIGAMAGLLTAPKPGRETREDIASRASEMVDDTKAAYEAKREQVGDIYATQKERVSEKATELTEKITAGTESVKERIDDLGAKAQEKIEATKGRFHKSPEEEVPEG